MATAAELRLQIQGKTRVLVVREDAADPEPIVQEISPALAVLDTSAVCPPVKLNDWLVANHRCPCEPRRTAEEELAKKVEQLAQSNRDLEQFAFVASHDLQEPLRMVAAYTQLLAQKYKGRLDTDADKYIAYASSGAIRLQALIRDLLEFSRVGRGEKACQVVDAHRALQDALHNLSQTIVESGAVVHTAQLPMVRADRSQLTQVFQNLVGNAIKFRSEESPVIAVHVERAGPYHLFSVSDNGIGIAPEHAERVFVIFQQLHARSEYAGNGIGLAICRRIIERFGGRIWLEAREEKGATFKFTLPVVAANDSYAGDAKAVANQEADDDTDAARAPRG